MPRRLLEEHHYVPSHPPRLTSPPPMPHHFGHEKLIVYQKAIQFVSWTNGLLKRCRGKAAAKDHLPRAASSIPVNIAEGNGRFSMGERCRFLEIAHTSALRCAATLDVLVACGTLKEDEVEEGKTMLAEIVSQLIGWSDSLRSREDKRP